MVEIVEMKNGARIILESMNEVRSVSMGVFIKVGSRCETSEIEGASHFVEHMLFKGTNRFNAQTLVEAFENLGGQLNAYTTREYTCVHGRTLDEDALKGLDIIFDMLFESQFDSEEFALEKAVILEEIKMYEDTPDELVHDIFSQKLFQGHRLGHPILGTAETVSQMTREALYQYYQEYYQPRNMVIAIAGKIDSKAVKDYVETYFSNKKNTPFNVEPVLNYSYKPFIEVIGKDVEQVQICLGVPGICYFDERRPVLNMMNSILGGGMSSRLFQSLREKRGLAYSVYAYGAAYADIGLYAIYAGISAQRLSEFFSALKEELTDFISNGVTEEELQRAQQTFKAGLYMGLENVSGRMNRMGRSLLLQSEYRSPEELVKEIYEVNPQNIRDLTQELLEAEPISMAAVANKNILSTVKQEFFDSFR